LDDFKEQLKDALDCYFNDSPEKPSVARLYFVRDALMAI